MKFKDGDIVRLINVSEFVERRGQGALTDKELRGTFTVTNTQILETKESILACTSTLSRIGFWEREQYLELVNSE